MKKSKKVISLILSVVLVFSVMSIGSISAFAASKTTNYSQFNKPEKDDYAYWNEKKMIKGKNTQKSEVQYMQAALNYCIKYRVLKADMLEADSSFGPATKRQQKHFKKLSD